MRPYGFAFFILLDAGKNEPPSSMVVLFDSAKSAEPPQSSGSCAAKAFITLPLAARVASSLSLGNSGTLNFGSCFESNRSKSADFS